MEINVCVFSKFVSSIVLGNKLMTNFVFSKTLKNEGCYVSNIQGVQENRSDALHLPEVTSN
jgi:hypothetical protein